MKKCMIMAALACAMSTMSFAEGQEQDKPRRKSVIELLREKRGVTAKPTGGYVVQGYDRNIIAIRDGQTVFKAEEVENAISELRKRMGLPVFRLAPDEKRDKIGAEVELVDDLSCGKARGILAAPEESWSKMSVRRLTVDNPDEAKRAHRLKVELFRAAMLSMGIGYSFYQPCLMAQVRTLADIDSIRTERWTPNTEGSYDVVAEKLGIGRVVVMTYRQACRRGWAPKPANEEQKKIWDEIMTIPEKPITIEKTK